MIILKGLTLKSARPATVYGVNAGHGYIDVVINNVHYFFHHSQLEELSRLCPSNEPSSSLSTSPTPTNPPCSEPPNKWPNLSEKTALTLSGSNLGHPPAQPLHQDSEFPPAEVLRPNPPTS